MYNKFYLFIFIAIVAILAGGFIYANYANNKTEEPVMCTMEAMACPDGSYVGRSGPKCEFAKCPSPNVISNSIIKGKVTVGPICPVERPDQPCPVPPEAYTSREVILYANNGMTVVKRMHFLPDGTYSFSVSPGTYVLDTLRQPVGGAQGLPKTITVIGGQTVEYNFSIDTGIR